MAVLWVKASAVIDNNYQIDKEMHKKIKPRRLLDFLFQQTNYLNDKGTFKYHFTHRLGGRGPRVIIK